MPSSLSLLRDLLAHAATQPAHRRADLDAEADLRTDPTDLGLPAGLELRWLGVAGFALTCEGVTVLIDPYVSRLGVGDLARRRVVAADRAQIDRHVPRADAILLGHTHFDHALDAPEIARRDGAAVYGGASAVRLMALHGLADRTVEVVAHRPFEVGPFRITFVPSAHAKLLLGWRTPSDGEITCEHLEQLTPKAYCCGQVWGIHIEVAGATLYHQGSADLLDDEVRHRDVDLFLCGIAGRQVTPDYVPRILGRLRPKQIAIAHQDDFLRPLAEPARSAFGVDLARFPDEVAAVSRQIPVHVLPGPFGTS